MKIFLDSVDLDVIAKYSEYGIVDGVTTNPSLISKASGKFADVVEKICDLVKGDVSVEVISEDYDGMVQEGTKILEIAGNIVLKLPSTWDGLKACKYFTDVGHSVNMTLCFSVHQALLAAKAGAKYISPFVGRLEDIDEDGLGLIYDIREIFSNYEIKTQILAASIRNLDHVREVAIAGADVATLPPKLVASLLDHRLTSEGLAKFREDWIKSGMKIEY